MARAPWAVAALLALAACGTYEEPEASVEMPRVRILGTAQDGGIPHVACSGDHCRAARRDPARRRLVASLAIELPSGNTYLIDATPDLGEQLELLAGGDRPEGVDRSPVAGVFLTHAHIGHYLGLALFGYEAVHTRELPVWGTPAMNEFLRSHGPWSLLVERQNIDLRPLAGPVELEGEVRVTAMKVPHRDEFADTVGFVLEGPSRRVLYVPDTDSWDAWEPSIESVVESVDVALVDATFYSTDELPGRSVSSIGHPLVVDSLERLANLRAQGHRVIFTHLNHSNPLVDPASEAYRSVIDAGFEVAEDGAFIGL